MMSWLNYSDFMVHLWKRKSTGAYYVVWQENSRQRKKSLRTRDRRTATRKLRNFKRDLIAGKVKPISAGLRRKLFQFADEFLEHVASTTSPGTYELYEEAMSKTKDCWGDIPLAHITPRHIDQLVGDMIRAGLKIPTVNKNYRHVKAALNKAYEWEYLSKPIRFPKPLKQEEKVRRLSDKQLMRVMEKIDDREFADLCMFSAYTALRSGEIIRLQWDDVDNPKGFLRISAKQKNKQESQIPINTPARGILAHCRTRGGEKPFRFKTRQTVSKRFKAAAREAGLGRFRFHDLRHTFGNKMAEKQENEATIQKLMRHKSITSTFIYTRGVSQEHLREASEKLNYGPMPMHIKKKK